MQENNFIPLDVKLKDNKDCFSKIPCYDQEGYKVMVDIKKLKQGRKKFLSVHKSNLFSIENINHFGKINNLSSVCINKNYVDANGLLRFKCNCGNEFITSWNNFKQKKRTKCNNCTKYHKGLTYEYVKNILYNKGLFLLVLKEDYKSVTLTPLVCKDLEGNKFIARFDAAAKGVVPHIVDKCNPYSIDNINLYLHNYTENKYVCISEDYSGSKCKNLKVLHKKCNKIFLTSWRQLVRHKDNFKITKDIICPFCGSNTESWHAIILKQIFLHEYNDTITEDRSCINPLTNCVIPTDIVNHNLKIAIEIQSEYHDRKNQKAKDKLKKEFWINKGYSFFDPDIREYNILQMINLFFPDIKKLPSYIDYSQGNKLNINMIQQLLNEGYAVLEIGKIMKVNPHRVYDAIGSNKVFYPSNYKYLNLTKQKHIIS